MSPRGTSPFADFGVLVNFARHLRRIRPAAFLGFTAKPNIYGSLAAGLCGVPVINNISGLGAVFSHRDWLTKLVATLYRVALKRSSTVFFQNRDDLALFERMDLVRRGRAAVPSRAGGELVPFSARRAHSA